MVYSSGNRLEFRAALIEPLDWDAWFVVQTMHGAFRFTKRQFYGAFPNIVTSSSYRESGRYNGANLHIQAGQFLVQ